MNHHKIETVDFGSKDIYIFFPFPLFVSVYVYASLCDFVCIAVLLPFVLRFSVGFFVVVVVYFTYSIFSIFISTCYH